MNHYFFDANVSWRLSGMFASLESGNHTIIHITEDPRFSHNNNEFGNSTPDIEWIGTLGKDSYHWNAISGDTSIIDTAHERAALIESGITLFALDHNFSNSSGYAQASKLLHIWPEIIRFSQTKEPSIYVVKTGKRPAIETIRGGRKTKGGKF